MVIEAQCDPCSAFALVSMPLGGMIPTRSVAPTYPSDAAAPNRLEASILQTNGFLLFDEVPSLGISSLDLGRQVNLVALFVAEPSGGATSDDMVRCGRRALDLRQPDRKCCQPRITAGCQSSLGPSGCSGGQAKYGRRHKDRANGPNDWLLRFKAAA